MKEKAKKEVYSLEKEVLEIVEHSRKVASMIDNEKELLEDLQQIAIALHYTVETLRCKLGLPNIAQAVEAPKEYVADRKMVLMDHFPLTIRRRKIEKPTK